MKDLCWMQWSRNGPELAIGSAKGNLIVYNKRAAKLNSLLGKHAKKITCGAWNSQGQLALASEDKTVSLSTEKGDLISQDPFKAEPLEVHLPEAQGTGGMRRISVCLGGKSILVKDLSGPGATPLDMVFNAKYGDIVMHRWFDDQMFIVGFQTGHVLGVSAQPQNPGKELFVAQMFKFAVTSISICHSKQVCVCVCVCVHACVCVRAVTQSAMRQAESGGMR
jgi:WD repeat-containing protein 19